MIATGGSVVYGEAAMTHLRASARSCPPVALAARRSARAREPRGARRREAAPGQDLAALGRERAPLYRKWARHTVDADAPHEEVVARILAAVG